MTREPTAARNATPRVLTKSVVLLHEDVRADVAGEVASIPIIRSEEVRVQSWVGPHVVSIREGCEEVETGLVRRGVEIPFREELVLRPIRTHVVDEIDELVREPEIPTLARDHAGVLPPPGSLIGDDVIRRLRVALIRPLGVGNVPVPRMVH